MDAYDIFKKLTKGLKFKTHILGVKNNEQTKPKNTIIDIAKVEVKKEKVELPDIDEDGQITDCDENLDESSNDCAIDRYNSEEESDEEGSEGELQLMDGVKVGERRKKKKKKEKIITEDKKSKLELEEQNRFRNEHGIRVVGRAVPPALHSFSALAEDDKVAPHLRQNLMQCGYTEPTPIQRQAMPCMLENRQILACAPTGSGKTAAFLLPILQSLGGPQGGPRALVLCPTRELAKQIYREALRLSAGTNLRCNVISKITQNKMQEKQATLKKSDLVISTPNRLCFLLNQEGSGLSLDRIRWLIIDEADKMFEGSAEQESDFRRQLEQVMTACASRERRVAMFSATHTPAVAKWCRRNMRGLINITVGQRNAATELVEQELLFCGTESGKMVAFRQLVQQGLKPPVLVFVQSKDRAKQLFKELIYDGINVDAIHADRTQLQRDNVVKSFRLGKIWVLICTELMGRGIDFRGVNLVINYDFPPSAISYIHRIGRAGRAGQKGRAITFFTQDDVVNLRSIAAVMKHSGCEVPEYMLTLKQNANARKQRTKKAPSRDQISTILEGPRRKRKHSKSDEKDDEAEGAPVNKLYNKENKKHTKSADSTESAKKAKRRKIEKKNNSKNGSFKVKKRGKNQKKENSKRDLKNKKISKVMKK